MKLSKRRKKKAIIKDNTGHGLKGYEASFIEWVHTLEPISAEEIQEILLESGVSEEEIQQAVEWAKKEMYT